MMTRQRCSFACTTFQESSFRVDPISWESYKAHREVYSEEGHSRSIGVGAAVWYVTRMAERRR